MMYSNSREFGSTAALTSETLKLHWGALYLTPGLLFIVFLMPSLLSLGSGVSWVKWPALSQQATWWHLMVIYMLAGLLTVPRTLIALSAGFFLGIKAGLVAAFLGWLLGAFPAYIIGYYLAGRLLPNFRFISHNFKTIQQLAQKQGFKAVLFCRLAPVFPFGWSSYVLGSMKVGFGDYINGSLLGAPLLILAYVSLGQSANMIGRLLSSARTMPPALIYTLPSLTLAMLAATLFAGFYFKNRTVPSALI